MELSSSAIGVLRVGLQVVSNHRRPMLEIYSEVRNRIRCDTAEKRSGDITEKRETKHPEIFIQFSLVNIGGVRAEDVEVKLTGDFKRNPPRDFFGEIFDSEISQMAPGQAIHLFRIELGDLYNYSTVDGKRQGIKDENFSVVVSYNASSSWLNYLLHLHRRIRGKKQYETRFAFNPKTACTDLPPVEYV